jgi:hypothetical protein
MTDQNTPVRFDQLVGMIGNKTVKKLVQAKALMVFARMVQVAWQIKCFHGPGQMI